MALSDQPVTTMGGLRVLPDLTLDKLKPTSSGMLILPGGEAWDKKKNEEAALLAVGFCLEILVVAICEATVGLARIGLLDNVPHTSNLKEYIAATGYKGAAFYSSKPSVKLGQIITASAMSALGFSRDVFAVLDVCSEATSVPGTSYTKRAMESIFPALMNSIDM